MKQLLPNGQTLVTYTNRQASRRPTLPVVKNFQLDFGVDDETDFTFLFEWTLKSGVRVFYVYHQPGSSDIDVMFATIDRLNWRILGFTGESPNGGTLFNSQVRSGWFVDKILI